MQAQETLWQGINFVVSFGVITLLFALIFKVLPDMEIAWRDVWIGAIITALLFNVGKHLFGLYLGRSSVSSVFGVEFCGLGHEILATLTKRIVF